MFLFDRTSPLPKKRTGAAPGWTLCHWSEPSVAGCQPVGTHVGYLGVSVSIKSTSQGGVHFRCPKLTPPAPDRMLRGPLSSGGRSGEGLHPVFWAQVGPSIPGSPIDSYVKQSRLRLPAVQARPAAPGSVRAWSGAPLPSSARPSPPGGHPKSGGGLHCRRRRLTGSLGWVGGLQQAHPGGPVLQGQDGRGRTLPGHRSPFPGGTPQGKG